MATIVKNENLLKALLENILRISIDEIKVNNPKLIQNRIKNRNQNLDLLIKSNNIYINVEINTNYQQSVINRNLLYAFKIATDSSKKGKFYAFDKKTIQINLNFGHQAKEVVNKYDLYDVEHKKKLSDILIIYEVNVDKAKEIYYNGNKKFILENIPIIMLDLPREELDKLSKESEIVEEYKKKVEEVNDDEQFSWILTDEEEAEAYEEFIKETSMNEGLEKGLEQSTNRIAINMLKQKIDITAISKCTGLSIEEIKNLK